MQIIGVGLTPILRNHGHTVLAMTIMISGFITNIVVDAICIMVFDWGLAGAAIATVAGQTLVTVCTLTAIFINKEMRIKPTEMKLIRSTAASLFMKLPAKGSSVLVFNLMSAIFIPLFPT